MLNRHYSPRSIFPRYWLLCGRLTFDLDQEVAEFLRRFPEQTDDRLVDLCVGQLAMEAKYKVLQLDDACVDKHYVVTVEKLDDSFEVC